MSDLLNMLKSGANNKTILTIDEPSRSINYNGELVLGVECDKQAERIYFNIPKTIIMGNSEPVDLSSSNVEIFINFENALGNTYRYQSVDKAAISGNAEMVEFSWVISNEVTASKGTVKFSVSVNVLNQDNEITNEWYTIPFEGKILKGISVTDATMEVIVYPQSSMALLTEEVKEFRAFLSDYKGYTKGETDSKIDALDSKYALKTTVSSIIAPTTSGINGQILKSQGSGKPPIWTILDADDIPVDNGIGLGLVTGTSNLTNHLQAIYEFIDRLPDQSDVENTVSNAIKNVTISSLNITSADISHEGSDLYQLLTGITTNVENSFNSATVSGSDIIFTNNKGLTSSISIPTPTNTKEWKPVTMKKYDDSSEMAIDEVVSNVANTSFLASSMGGSGYFIFKFEDDILHQHKYYMGYVNLDNSDKLYNGYSYLKGLVANIVQNPGTEGSTINRYEEYLRIKFTDYNTSGIKNSVGLTFCVVIDNKIYENYHSYYDGMPEFLRLTFKGAWRLDL